MTVGATITTRWCLHYTLVSDPGHDSGKCVIVNWTTRRRRATEDASCILNRLDHPAITDESLVNYYGARLLPTPEVQHRINSGVFGISDVLLTKEAYDRLMLGFQVTQKVPIGVYEFLDGAGFLPAVP